MTDKTENNKVFDEKKILAVSLGFFILQNVLHLLADGIQIIMELPGAITKCSGRSADGFPLNVAIKLVCNLAVIMTGIFMDLALNR